MDESPTGRGLTVLLHTVICVDCKHMPSGLLYMPFSGLPFKIKALPQPPGDSLHGSRPCQMSARAPG